MGTFFLIRWIVIGFSLSIGFRTDFGKTKTEEEGKMNVTRIVGIILVVLGAIVVLGSSLADLVVRGLPGFGLKQAAGVVVGAIDVVLGLILLLRKKAS
jgi:hypothetical protein